MLLWVVVGAGWWWADTTAIKHLVAPVTAVHPNTAAAPPPLYPGHPLAQRVVLVMLSGVGASSLNDPANPFAFGTLRRLAAEGAWGISDSVVPSGDLPTWTALLSGASPRSSGVASEQGKASLGDSLLSKVNSRLVIGSQRALTSRNIVLGAAQVQEIASSERVAEAASTTLRRDHSQLVVIVLDLARREQYSGSQLWERMDTQLAEITSALDPQHDSLVVTADHGLLANGSFGGEEPTVTQTPLVLWGAGITAGPVGTVHQIDLAPTVALLLGTEPPALSAGRPLFEVLDLAPQEQARAHLVWLDQQVALQQRLTGKRAAAQEVEAAHRAFAKGDWAATAVAVGAAEQQLTSASPPLSLGGSVYLWSIGLPLLLLLGARLLARWGRRVARWLALAVLGAELYILAWALIFFVLAGRTLSLSALYSNMWGQLVSVGAWAVLALSVAVLPLTWATVGQGPRYTLQQVGRLVGLLELVGTLVAVAIVIAVKQPLAQTGAWAGLLVVLAQLAGVGLAAPAVGGFAAALTDVFERGR